MNQLFFDIPEFWQLGFQEPATPFMEGLLRLHHDIFFFLIIIFIAVTWTLARIIWFYTDSYENASVGIQERMSYWETTSENQFTYSKLFGARLAPGVFLPRKILKPFPIVHDSLLEFIWTLIPSLILTLLSLPTSTPIYALEDITTPLLYLKVIGHQWYWSHEYDRGLTTPSFDAHMKIDSLTAPTSRLDPNVHLWLLGVDNNVILPVRTHIRALITATDVLHSWAIPSLGVKMDACPGRLNQVNLFISWTGLFYGQCSEICGVNHAFMPIGVEAV